MTSDETPSKTRGLIEEAKAKADQAAGRIDKLGGSVKGLAEAQHSFMLEWIYNNLMTEAQREDFLLAWYTELNEQLVKMEGRLRDAEIVAQQRAAAGPQLLTPGSPGLIVPGNVRGQGRKR